MPEYALDAADRFLADPSATDRLGTALGRCLGALAPSITNQGFQLALSGDLGTGKTAIVRAALRSLGVTGPIKSPTFSLLEPYEVSRLDFYHFDFYRFEDPSEFAAAGFREAFGPGRICAIEWPEKAGSRLPTADLAISLSVKGAGRRAHITATSEQGRTCLRNILKSLSSDDA